MPLVELTTSRGRVEKFGYTISTPSHTSTDAVDPELPTILFIAPTYISKEGYHEQFKDPGLRRFNLVTLDMRGHSESMPVFIDEDWDVKMAAEDIKIFMSTIGIEKCHLLGQASGGASTALQVAISYPHLLESLFLVSPVPQKENPAIAESRQEIWNVWKDGFEKITNDLAVAESLARTDSDSGVKRAVKEKLSKDDQLANELRDSEEVYDCKQGAIQLATNGMTSPLLQALADFSKAEYVKRWCPTAFEEGQRLFVDWLSVPPHTKDELSQIRVPVCLIHCSGDVAYPIESAKELKQDMLNANVQDVTLHQIKGAGHFGCLT